MTALLANNAGSRLAGAVDTTQTSITVQSADAAKFPSPTGGDWFPLTLIKPDGQLEIVRATARSGDVITVVREQEGTTPKAFDVGDRVELRITKAVMDGLATDEDVALKRDLDNNSFPRYDLSVLSTTAALDLAAYNEFTVDASTPRTLAFANIPTGKAMTVVITISGNSAITWPAGITWIGETAPELGATKTVVVLHYETSGFTGFLGGAL